MSETTRVIREQIANTNLSAVTFVQDYVQLDFDGPKFNVMTPIMVSSSNAKVVSGDEQFRNRLCAEIGKAVSDVTVKEHESLLIDFADGSAIGVSLREEDYPGPEALVFSGTGGVWVVI